MDQYNFFGVIRNNVANGFSRGAIRAFYCSGPITKAYLKINDIEIPSKIVYYDTYAQPASMYRIVFLYNDLVFPFTDTETTYSFRVENGKDGYVLFYINA